MQTMLSKTRFLTIPLIMIFLVMGLALQTAAAGIVGTQTILSEHADTERSDILSLLDRNDVRDKLVEYGVSPQEAAERVASLTDSETLELAQNIDSLPAGGGAVTLLLVVILLLLILR